MTMSTPRPTRITAPRLPPTAPPTVAALTPDELWDVGVTDWLVDDVVEDTSELVLLDELADEELADDKAEGTAVAEAPMPLRTAPGVATGVPWIAFAIARKAV